jgi:excisionase family DNA binding protein
MSFLTLEDVSKQIHVPVSTLRWWIQQGRLPAYRPGRKVLIREDELLAFIASNAKRGTKRSDTPRAASAALSG